MDSNEFIPCDLCEEMIRFEDYQNHMQECTNEHRNGDNPLVEDGFIPITNIVPFLFHIPVGVSSSQNNMETPTLNQTPIPAWVQQIAHMFDVDAAVQSPLHIIENNMSDYELNTMLSEFMGGNVYVGVSDVSKVVHVVNDPLELPQDDTLCAICQECLKTKIAEAAHVVKTTCQHHFCKDCILQWLGQSKKCPVCLHELEK